MRGKVGTQWAYEKSRNAELAASYKAVGRSYQAQRLFRKEWATKVYTDLKEEREKTQTHAVAYGKFGPALQVVVACDATNTATHTHTHTCVRSSWLAVCGRWQASAVANPPFEVAWGKLGLPLVNSKGG
jgi:hypothetical protein